jgi:hypothetical protein
MQVLFSSPKSIPSSDFRGMYYLDLQVKQAVC